MSEPQVIGIAYNPVIPHASVSFLNRLIFDAPPRKKAEVLDQLTARGLVDEWRFYDLDELHSPSVGRGHFYLMTVEPGSDVRISWGDEPRDGRACDRAASRAGLGRW